MKYSIVRSILVGLALLAVLVTAAVVGAPGASADTKVIKFEGSGNHNVLDVKVKCDACVPDLFVSGVGQAVFTLKINTTADLSGSTNLRHKLVPRRGLE